MVAGITSNEKMHGILLTQKDDAVKDCVVKLNYIFTISNIMVEKVLFSLSKDKKKKVYDAFVEKIKVLV